MNVTAAEAEELTEAAAAGQNDVSAAEEALKAANDVRAPARKATLGLMSTLIANLNKKLAPDDPRWLSFGLRMPATPTTPGKVQNVVVTLDDSDAIIVQWRAEPLATRYRGRMMILGVDTKYRLAFSGSALIGTITGVEPGVTVQIVVEAVNEDSQGVASDPVLFTMPVTGASDATAKTVAPAVEVAPLVASSPSGNGNGNGAYAGNRLS